MNENFKYRYYQRTDGTLSIICVCKVFVMSAYLSSKRVTPYVLDVNINFVISLAKLQIEDAAS